MRVLFYIFLMLALYGCASSTIKAPCDYAGHFCGKKIPINKLGGGE